MPKKAREYLHVALNLAAAALVAFGLLVFYGSVSFEGYIGGLLFLALAAAVFLGARELRPNDARAARYARIDDEDRQKIRGELERRIEPR